jgi:hypothetical protein
MDLPAAPAWSIKGGKSSKCKITKCFLNYQNTNQEVQDLFIIYQVLDINLLHTLTPNRKDSIVAIILAIRVQLNMIQENIGVLHQLFHFLKTKNFKIVKIEIQLLTPIIITSMLLRKKALISQLDRNVRE